MTGGMSGLAIGVGLDCPGFKYPFVSASFFIAPRSVLDFASGYKTVGRLGLTTATAGFITAEAEIFLADGVFKARPEAITGDTTGMGSIPNLRGFCAKGAAIETGFSFGGNAITLWGAALAALIDAV